MFFPDWQQALEAVFAQFAGLMPTLLASAALLLVVWGLAYAAGILTRKLLERIAARIEPRFERSGTLRASGLMRRTPRVLGKFVFWSVLLVFATAALETMPLPIVTELLQGVSRVLPRTLLAVAIVLVGFVAANLANHWIAGIALRAGSEYGQALGRVAQGVIVVVTLIIGVEQVGLQGGVFTSLLTVVLASTLGAMSLAFALGSGPVVTNLLASHYASKTLSIGDTVRFGDVEGTIREIGPTSIAIDAGADRIYLPAKKYCDEICIVVGPTQ